jgi:hypothetical protein
MTCSIGATSNFDDTIEEEKSLLLSQSLEQNQIPTSDRNLSNCSMSSSDEIEVTNIEIRLEVVTKVYKAMSKQGTLRLSLRTIIAASAQWP